MNTSGLMRIAKNMYIDFRIQGKFLGGTVDSVDKEKGVFDTANSDYSAIQKIFFELNTIKPEDIIVDIGCGKGRVINYLLYKKVRNPIIGIEYNPEVAAVTQKRLNRFSNVSIIAGDATEKMPLNTTVVYLFNPFGPELMTKFRDRLLQCSPAIRVFYYNPRHTAVFDGDDRFQIDYYDSNRSGMRWDLAVISFNNRS